MTSARVFILSGRHIGTDLRVDGPAVLGRGDDADLVLRDPSVSRAHARLTPEAEGWRLIDLGSSNGCFVGGERVETALLRDRDEFRLGNLELRLRVEAGPEAAPAQPPPTAEPAQVPSVPQPAASPAPAPAPDPPVAPPAEPPAEPADFELELEGEWDEDAAPVPVRAPETPAPPAPRSASTPSAEAAPMAVGSAVRGRGPGQDRDLAGRPVLRSQGGAGGRGGLLSSDLSQQPALVRWGMILLALALFAGVVWGSFRLVFGVRQARQAPTVDLAE